MIPTIPTTPETTESQLTVPPPPPKFIDDAAPDAAEEARREAAFDASHTWRGRTLLPFSSSRKSLFLQHRVAMGAPDLSQCMKDLDGFLADAIRIIFLCSYTPEAPIHANGEGWSRLRCQPHLLQAAMDEWADRHLLPGTEHTAVMLGYQIYAASLANRHEPAPPPRGASDELGN